MERPLSSRQPSFVYRWKPDVQALIDQNKRYHLAVIQDQSLLKSGTEDFDEKQNRINQLESAGISSRVNREILEREMTHFNVERDRRRRKLIEMLSVIESDALPVAGMLQDIIDDYGSQYNDRVTHSQFIEYLSDMNRVLESGKGLECYTKSLFVKIAEVIAKFLPTLEVVA